MHQQPPMVCETDERQYQRGTAHAARATTHPSNKPTSRQHRHPPHNSPYIPPNLRTNTADTQHHIPPWCLQYGPYEFPRTTRNVLPSMCWQPARIHIRQSHPERPIPFLSRSHSGPDHQTSTTIQSHRERPHGTASAGHTVNAQPTQANPRRTPRTGRHEPAAGGVRRARQRNVLLRRPGGRQRGGHLFRPDGQIPGNVTRRHAIPFRRVRLRRKRDNHPTATKSRG